MTEVAVKNTDEIRECLTHVISGLSKEGMRNILYQEQLHAFSDHVNQVLSEIKVIPDGCRFRISRQSVAVIKDNQVIYEKEYPLLLAEQYASLYNIAPGKAKKWTKRMHKDFYTESPLKIRNVAVKSTKKAFAGKQDLFFMIDLCFMREVLRCEQTGEEPQVFVSE